MVNSKPFDYQGVIDRQRQAHITANSPKPSPDRAARFNDLMKQAGLGHTLMATWLGVPRDQVRYAYSIRGEVPDALFDALETLVHETLPTFRQINNSSTVEPFDELAAWRELIDKDVIPTVAHFAEHPHSGGFSDLPKWVWQKAYGEVEGAELFDRWERSNNRVDPRTDHAPLAAQPVAIQTTPPPLTQIDDQALQDVMAAVAGDPEIPRSSPAITLPAAPTPPLDDETDHEWLAEFIRVADEKAARRQRFAQTTTPGLAAGIEQEINPVAPFSMEDL